MRRERTIPYSLKDGSIVWDRDEGIIGPSDSDQEWANNLNDKDVLLPEALIQENRPTFLNRFPLSAIFGFKLEFPALALTVLAVACGGDAFDDLEDVQKRANDREANRANSERFIDEPFLDWPFDNDLPIKVQQGWFLTDGSAHEAVDLILGDVGDSSTWDTFEVLSAADGEACVNPPNRQGKAVLVEHNVDGVIAYTYYGHMDSVDSRFPDCQDTESSDWAVVSQGDHLGWAGSTGAENPNWVHVHFQYNNADGSQTDPYDLYTTRDSYPDAQFTNGQFCGDSTLWINCPTESELPEPINPILIRQELIDRNWQIVEEQTRRFFDLLKSGSPGDLARARAMLVSEGLESEWNYYNFGTARALANCGWEVSEGGFQNLTTERRFSPNANLTDLERQNIELGRAARDRYRITLNFDMSDYNSRYDTVDGRGPLRHYDGVNNSLYFEFEDVDGRLLIADLAACLKSPLGTVVNQPIGR